MQNKIYVEPDRLIDVSNKMESYSFDFDNTCNRLYEEVENMKLNWSGKDNVAFVTQLQDYKQELVKVGFLLRQYATFLKTSAMSYSETQDEIYSSIMRLRK